MLTALLLCLASGAQDASICFDINRKALDTRLQRGYYYELMADYSQDVEDKIVTTQHLIDVERTNYPDKYPGKINQIVSLML